MKSVLIVLAHQDDELFLLPKLMELLEEGAQIKCVYLTTQPNELANVREMESLKVLSKLGMKPHNVEFLGRRFSILDGALHLKAKQAFDALLEIAQTSNFHEFYTPLREGGHQDHDACCLIVASLRSLHFPSAALLGFPLYNGENLIGKIFATNSVIKIYRPCSKKVYFSFPVAWTTICAMFQYRSQWLTFLGLGPQFTWYTLFLRMHYVIDLSNFSVAQLLKSPHQGFLLYERFGRVSCREVDEFLSEFLSDIRLISSGSSKK